MSLVWAMIFGGLGTTFGRLGTRSAPTGGGGSPSTAGEPIGLLLALTKAA